MIGFVAGVAVGFVLGARAGRERYEQIKAVARQTWTSEPVQNGLEQAGHTMKTQALPYLADKTGDAVKAAGQKVKERASKTPLPATVRRDANGTAYADVTTAPGVPMTERVDGSKVPTKGP